MAFLEAYCNASTGSNMNGGSDENASPSYAATNGGWNSGTGVFTPTAGDPSASVTVGQLASVFLDGATSPVFVARVTAVNTTTVTVSTTAKMGTAPTTGASGISINVGGVWKGMNGTDAFPFSMLNGTLIGASNETLRVNFKNNATYSITAACSNFNTGPFTLQGYSSTVGDGGKAVIDGGTAGSAYVLLTIVAGRIAHVDLILQNNGASGANSLYSVGGAANFYRCVFNSSRGTGVNSTQPAIFVECEAYNCNLEGGTNVGGFAATTSLVICTRCISHDNTGGTSNGFQISSGTMVCIDCIADSNSGSGFVATAGGAVNLQNCVSYGNTLDGFRASANGNLTAMNCLFVNNGAYGINLTTPAGSVALVSTNGFFGNASGQTTGVTSPVAVSAVTLTADPFANAAGGDFDLNAVIGGGATCKNAGLGTFTETASNYTGTLSFPDLGASQHQETGVIIGTVLGR